jgi:hypothetical protein
MNILFRQQRLVCAGVGFILGLTVLASNAEAFADEDAAYRNSDSADASPQQRRGRGAPERGVYKARITPHWLTNVAQFWYRNDLRGCAREFILVDAERATRQPAFDHKAVAKLIGATDGARLPVEELRFSDDGQSVTLINPTNTWRLILKTGKLETNQLAMVKAVGLKAETQSRPSLRNGPDTQITFDNQRDQAVAVLWVDDLGSRQSYGEVAALRHFGCGLSRAAPLSGFGRIAGIGPIRSLLEQPADQGLADLNTAVRTRTSSSATLWPCNPPDSNRAISCWIFSSRARRTGGGSDSFFWRPRCFGGFPG